MHNSVIIEESKIMWQVRKMYIFEDVRTTQTHNKLNLKFVANLLKGFFFQTQRRQIEYNGHNQFRVKKKTDSEEEL